MPSIAAFIRELISEDKYASDFSDKIGERVKELNIAQLHGIHHVLTESAKNAKTHLWRNANQTIIDRIQEELQAKEKLHQAEAKVLEDHRVQRRQKAERMQAVQKEEARVREMIVEKARTDAETQVREREMERQNQERFAIMKKVFDAEELRDTWWKRLAVLYLVVVPLVVVMLTVVAPMPLFVLIAAVGGVTGLAVLAAYRCHLWTIVKPIVVPPQYIDAQIEQLQDTLTKQAFSVLREKERKFQEQMEKDKLDAKKRRRERREKQRLQAAMLEQQRLERIAMAKEIIERQQGSQRSGNSVAGDQDSLALESIEELDEEEAIQRLEQIEEGEEGNDMHPQSEPKEELQRVPEVSDDELDMGSPERAHYVVEEETRGSNDNPREREGEYLRDFVDELMAETKDIVCESDMDHRESRPFNGKDEDEDEQVRLAVRHKPRAPAKPSPRSTAPISGDELV